MLSSKIIFLLLPTVVSFDCKNSYFSKYIVVIRMLILTELFFLLVNYFNGNFKVIQEIIWKSLRLFPQRYQNTRKIRKINNLINFKESLANDL